MDSSSIIIWFIIICIIFLILTIISRPIVLFKRFIKQCSVGIVLILSINYLLSPFGIFIGVNFITALTVGVLGIPGLASLYIFQLFF